MSTRPAPPVGALVLCGGRSRRMGRDKAWLPVGAETAVERVSGSLRRVGLPVVLVARPGQALPVESDATPPLLEIWRDPAPIVDGGPLRALAAALAGPAREFERVFVVATDAVAVDPTDAVDLLARCEAAGCEAAVVRDGAGRLQPLLAAYRVAATLRACRTALDHGESSLRAMLSRLRVEPTSVHTLRGPLAVAPSNTPAEWAALTERMLDGRSG